jgi:arylsulfatase A-like enzyme
MTEPGQRSRTRPARARFALAALLVAACGTGDQKDPLVEAPRPVTAGAAGPRDSGPATALASAADAAGPTDAALAASPPDAAVAPAAEARDAERPVYSLVDNRLAAHLGRGGGLLVAAGSAGFAKYIRVGNGLAGDKPAWLLRQREGAVAVARLADVRGQVFAPLTRAQAERPAVRVRVHSAKAGMLRLQVRGGTLLERWIGKGWSTVDFDAAGQLREGENALELSSSTPGLAVAWLEVGAAPREAGESEASRARFYDPARQALVLPRDGQMSWYVFVPDRARLVAGVGSGCTVRVLATASDGAAIEGTLAGPRGAVDLAGVAGKAARLDLEAAGCAAKPAKPAKGKRAEPAKPAEPADGRTLVTGAAIVVPGAAPEVVRGAPPKYVLFVVMDSLRFDRVHAFEPTARAETPVLDRLAAASTVFANHYVQGNESQVSHASMWTSMYLAKHKAARWEDKIPSRFFTLDEVAQRSGKYPAAATGNGYIRPSRGYGKAWVKFTNHIEEGLGLRSTAIIERGLSFVEKRKTSPWFLYLGLIDTHVTWRAKQPWIERYDPGYQGRFATEFGDSADEGFPKDLTEREKDHVRAIYDSNVSYQDEQLGILIEKLQAWGVWAQTMLVLTADHGDEQWENGRIGHEAGQDETLLHVPLLVRYPPLFPVGRVEHGSEGVDILPTIADALGVAPDAEWQGMSLLPAAHGAYVDPGLVSSSEYERQHGARVGPWKLRLAGAADPALFYLATDPHETQNIYGASAAAIGGRLVLDAMALLRAHHAEWRKSRWGTAANVSPRFAADLGE